MQSWTDRVVAVSTGSQPQTPAAPHLDERPIMAEQTFRIASIPADGVGKEVVAAGRRVLDAMAEASDGSFAFEWQEFPWGSAYYAEHGVMMAEDGLDQLRDFDAI